MKKSELKQIIKECLLEESKEKPLPLIKKAEKVFLKISKSADMLFKDILEMDDKLWSVFDDEKICDVTNDTWNKKTFSSLHNILSGLAHDGSRASGGCTRYIRNYKKPS